MEEIIVKVGNGIPYSQMSLYFIIHLTYNWWWAVTKVFASVSLSDSEIFLLPLNKLLSFVFWTLEISVAFTSLFPLRSNDLWKTHNSGKGVWAKNAGRNWLVKPVWWWHRQNLLSFYYAPSTVLITSHTLLHVSLTALLWGRYSYCPHFIGEEIEVQKS